MQPRIASVALTGAPRLEAAVREVAVEADRRPERADDVEADEAARGRPSGTRRPRAGPSPRASPSGGTSTATQRHDLADAGSSGADGPTAYRGTASRVRRHRSSRDARRSNRYSLRGANNRFDADRGHRSGDLRARGGVPALARARGARSSSATAAPAGTRTPSSTTGSALDTGFLVHNERNYPLLDAAVRASWACDAARPRCRSRSAAPAAGSSTRPPAVRAAAQRGEPAVPGLLWEIGRWLRTARRSLDEAATSGARSREYLDERGYSRRFRAPLPRAAHLGALVDRARPRARVPRRVRDPLLRQPRDARLRPLPLAHGHRREPHATSTRCSRRLDGARAARARRPRGPPRLPTASSCPTDDGERRRFDEVVIATHADQALAAARRTRATTSGACSAASRTRRTRPCSTPTRRSCRGRPPRAPSWNYRLGDDGRPTLTYYLNRLQRLEADERLLRDAERRTSPRSTCSRGSRTTHPLYTLGTLAAQRELPALSGARRTLVRRGAPRQRLPRGRARVGRRAPRAALGVDW